MAYVVEVLRGANSQRIRENAHDRLPVYGIGRDRSNEHWISVLRQLIHLGMVSQNITQHLALQLTESARPVLRGDVALMLAEPRVTNLKTHAVPKTYGGNYDRPLFAKLRKLRKTLAAAANVPPYVVFNDATLLEMAEQLPTDSGQMRQPCGGHRDSHPLTRGARCSGVLFQEQEKYVNAVCHRGDGAFNRPDIPRGTDFFFVSQTAASCSRHQAMYGVMGITLGVSHLGGGGAAGAVLYMLLSRMAWLHNLNYLWRRLVSLLDGLATAARCGASAGPGGR